MTKMRTSRLLALGVLLTLAAAGCAKKPDNGGGVATAQTGKPAASASATSSADPEAPLKFAQCMRAHGMTWFPDPKAGGRQTINTPKGMDPAKFSAAQEACKQYAPSGGAGQTMNPADLERARQMSKCMREHGVPNFPDPKPDGGISIDSSKLGTGPGNPTFDKAQQACSQYGPKGAGGPQTITGGPGSGIDLNGQTVQGGHA